MSLPEFPGGDYDEWKTTEPDDGPCDHPPCGACSLPACECQCEPEDTAPDPEAF